MMGSPYFPFFFDIRDWAVLIVGAGNVAARRAAALAEFGARLTVIAPAGCLQMEALEEAGQVRWLRRRIQETDLDTGDLRLVLAATDDPELNRALVSWCRRRKLLSNNCSDRSQCDFYFPGIVRDGDLVIGVTASGEGHGAVKETVREIRRMMEEGKTSKNRTAD